MEHNKNAAVVWRQAFDEIRRWPGLPESEPWSRRGRPDWRDETVYAADGEIRGHLEGNRAALDLAHRAGSYGACDWDLDCSRGGLLDAPHLAFLRELARLLHLQAIVAACSNDWGTFERSIRTAEAAVRRACQDSTVITCLVVAGTDCGLFAGERGLQYVLV